MRRTSAQVIAEFHKLYDCFETIADVIFNHDGHYWTTGMGQHIVTRTRMLEWVAEKKATPSEIWAGTRQAVNDMSEQLVYLLEDDPQLAADILGQYSTRTGREFWEDAGTPGKQLKAILLRGLIRDETEYRLISAWLADTTKIVLGKTDIPRAAEMMAKFETTAPPESP